MPRNIQKIEGENPSFPDRMAADREYQKSGLHSVRQNDKGIANANLQKILDVRARIQAEYVEGTRNLARAFEGQSLARTTLGG